MRSLTQALNRQFGHPHGPLEHLVGAVMAIENAKTNALVVGLLSLEESDCVLEIGCGPGVALARAAATAQYAAGVDPSSAMTRLARARLRRPIGRGTVQVEQAPVERLPFNPSTFTVAFAVNSVQHWESIDDGLTELRRVLKPDGRLLLALRAENPTGRRPDPHARGATRHQLDELVKQPRPSRLPLDPARPPPAET